MGFLQWLGGSGHWSRDDVRQAVTRLIDTVDPRVALLPGSEQKLKSGVRNTLDHATELIVNLPDALDLGPTGFTLDRRVGLLFASPESLCQLLLTSQTLREYFSHAANPDRAYLLLVMQCQVRQRLGSRLLPDGQVQNDVPQQVFSFDGHRVLAVYDSERALRQQAGMEAFNAMCRDLSRRLASAEMRRQQLDAERQRVQLRLQAAGQTLVNAGTLHSAQDVADKDLLVRQRELEAELAQLNKQLSLSGKLDCLRTAVRTPADYLQARLETVTLDRMGVVTPVADGGQEMGFGLIALGDTPVRERVVFPARVSRQDLREWQERWPQALSLR